MPRLRDDISVDRTAKRTMLGLERFFASQQSDDGVARLRLRVPIDGSHAFGLGIEREVCVEARRTRGERSLDDLMLIEWTPEGTAVLPSFHGTLIVRDGKPAKSRIELDGEYTPPFGAAGQIFDAAIGHQIAQRTAREFLSDLKAAIEKRSE